VIKITIATQKQTGISLGLNLKHRVTYFYLGWAILEFTTPENTMQVFDTFNGKQMPSAQSKATYEICHQQNMIYLEYLTSDLLLLNNHNRHL
jgi:hypothetical protein